jgi:hypothetical protein
MTLVQLLVLAVIVLAVMAAVCVLWAIFDAADEDRYWPVDSSPERPAGVPPRDAFFLTDGEDWLELDGRDAR